MHLNETDSSRFYKIWLGILEYTNQKYKTAPKLKAIRSAKSINPAELVPIRDVLWENTEIIDKFILENPYSLEQQDINILSGWKRRIPGRFIMLKHLKNYSVFMSAEDGGKLYAVTGIIDSLSDMFHSSHLPLFMEAVLIPFENRIIYDSLLIPYRIHIGSNMRKGFNEEYREIKAKQGIITAI